MALPQYVWDNIAVCDAESERLARRYNMFATWISVAGQTLSSEVTVDQGTASVGLWFNMVEVNCFNASDTGGRYVTNMTNYISSVDLEYTGSTGINGGDAHSVILAAGDSKGSNAMDNFGFHYSPDGGFTTSGTHTITVYFRTVYQRSDGTFACAEGLEISPGQENLCAEWDAQIVLNVTVTVPNDPPSGSVSATCAVGTGVITATVNGSDPDGGNVSVTVNVDNSASPASRTGSGSGNISLSGGNTFQGIPDGRTYTLTGTVTDDEGETRNLSGGTVVCPRPPLTANCTVTTSLTEPPNAAEVSEQFDISITVRNTSAQYGPSMSNSTHPLGISASGMSGVGPSPSYGPIAPGSSQTVSDLGLSSATPGTYYIYVDIGNYDVPPAGNATNDCSVRVIIGNKSYLKAFGGEVMAGGRFFNSAGTCPTVTAGRGGIYGWTAPKGNASDGTPLYGGSSAQLTVSSLLAVNQFYSVSNRRPPGGNTFPPKGLTMANNDPAQPWGGNYGNRRCVTNYFNDTRDAGLMAGNWNGVSFPAGVGRRQYTRNAGVVASGSTLTIPIGTQVAVFIDGDVDIRHNIEYAGGYSTWEQAPNFVMVVNGDIRIRNNVTRLDGLYIAQNNTIYTCTPTSAPLYDAGSVYSSCQTQLKINGGLIANDIRWLRLLGTVRNSAFQEVLDFADGSGTAAAETVNYTPQMWLARSPLKDPGDVPTSPTPGPDTHDAYDSIKSLPPIF